MRRSLRSLFVPLLAVSMGFAALAFQAPGGAVQASDSSEVQQYAALIGDYPKPGSDGAKADFAILLWLQRSRTAEEVRRAKSEVNLHLGVFSEVTGRDLDSAAFPLTQALVEDLGKDLRQVTSALKTRFGRPRPYVANALVKPAIKLEPNLSYPSGHSSWGTAQATLLAELLPERREAILERGRQVGYDRVIGGVHHPSDVEAGQVLGPVFAQAWLAVPAHRQRLEQARAEW
jgi:acid phosphatase (class A)